MKINEVILGPVLTEKATNLAKNKVYSFYVAREASKEQIKNVIETLYKVKVKEVRVAYQKGKRKKVGKWRLEKKLPAKKIAYVKLKEGSLEIFPTS